MNVRFPSQNIMDGTDLRSERCMYTPQFSLYSNYTLSYMPPIARTITFHVLIQVARPGLSRGQHIRGQFTGVLRGVCNIQFHDVPIGLPGRRSSAGAQARNFAPSASHVPIMLPTRLGDG